MTNKILIGLCTLIGIASVVTIGILAYVVHTQNVEIQYLQETNEILQSDYEEVSRKLKKEKQENQKLTSEKKILETELAEKQDELTMTVEELQIAKNAINSLQANNTSNRDDKKEKNVEPDNAGETDTLTEKDLQTLKEKILAGEMNNYLKEVIGSMNQMQLYKLAKDIGLL